MYLQKTFSDKLRELDVYRKLPKEYLQPSFLGALFSVISVSIMIILLITEVDKFITLKTTSQMLVDNQNNSNRLKINIDIILHRLPCSVLSIDIQDVMGNHAVNVEGTIVKNRLDKNGNILSKFEEEVNSMVMDNNKSKHRDLLKQPDYNQVKKAIQNKEGCQLYGNLNIFKVPGNFHISSHAYASTISKLATEGLYNFDLSHTVNHISFGDENDFKQIKSKFNIGMLNPIDNTTKKEISKKLIYEYYLSVVPTTYIDLGGNNYNVHQFTANSNEIKANMMVPAIFFRYDLSPILVKYTQQRERIFHFFIEICAIIGGIYMVTSVLLTFLVNSSGMFFKNKEK